MRQSQGQFKLVGQTPAERRWRNAALQFALWTAIGRFSASQLYSYYRYENRPFPFWRALLWQMPGWYLWGLLAPAITFFGKRFRIDRKNWLAPAALLFLGGALLALGHLTV